jgi:serine/threonine-protein kinase
MDYVEGLPIDEYCDKNRLNLSKRLSLFRTVCSALQYAHQNLIVHLDIKPSNILVTSDGVPKLLDFGISKLLNPDSLSDVADHTVTGFRRMTPEYASPEQIRGESLSISSDIYSLGVLLYLLLTGHLPYKFKNREAMEVARIVCEEQPERPSSAITRTVVLNGELHDPVYVLRSTSPDRLQRQLSGDLDNILLMALRKEPLRRYASVDQFSEDIRRHLEALPVSARKDTIRYRTGKFISRHRAAAVAVALVLISLIAGIITTTWQARIARQERDRARLEARKAEQINTFVQSMLSSADPEASGKDVTVAEILQEASRRVDTELKDQPEIAAEVKTTLAQTYMGLGLYEAAEPLLKSALDTRRRLYPEQSAEVALSLNHLALALESKGDLASAEPMIRKSLATLQTVHGKEHKDVAYVLNNLGEILLLKGDLNGAEQAHRQELEIRRKLFGNESAEVAESLNDLGVVLGTKGNIEEAEKFQREALRIIRKIRGNDHLEVASALSSIGSLVAQRNPNEAKKMFQESIAIREKKLGSSHPQVAWTRYNYAHLLYDEGNYEDAEKLLNQILELRGSTIPENHTMIHSSLLLMGRVLSDKGDPAKAEPFLREGLELRKKTLPEGHWLIASSLSSLGDCLIKLKRYSEAKDLLLTASKSLEKSLGKDHQRTRETIESLNKLYKAMETSK